MIIFDNISKSYSQKKNVLHGAHLVINRGERIVLFGSSGVGKTTLMKLLLTQEKPDKGSVHFDGINIHKLSPNDKYLYRRHIGVIFQDYKLLEKKNVYENVAFAMEMLGKSKEEIHDDVPHALELTSLEDKAFQFPHELSGGEQQRLAIARAIINQPDVLIADEPTSSLDIKSKNNILKILKKINNLGTTVIFVTHDKNIAEEFSNRVVSLENGKISENKVLETVM